MDEIRRHFIQCVSRCAFAAALILLLCACLPNTAFADDLADDGQSDFESSSLLDHYADDVHAPVSGEMDYSDENGSSEADSTAYDPEETPTGYADDFNAASDGSDVGGLGGSEADARAVAGNYDKSPDREPSVSEPHEDGWFEEGGLTYFYANGIKQTGWVVDSSYKAYGLQRYWLDTTDAHLVQNALIDAADAGWWAYARPEGFVVRGRYQAPDGSIYLADNDGKLEDPGWLITGAYTDGALQRYYIDYATYACKTGFFEADGCSYYGELETGFVLRSGASVAGRVVYANNDGVLFERGWLIADMLGFGLQRYWFEDCTAVASRLIDAVDAGWWAYARPEGFVVRGRYQAPDGLIYLADNDGKLEDPGWLITGAYTDGALQRYYIDADARACKTDYFDVGGAEYYGLPDLGYVLRGRLPKDQGILLADNDGKLAGSYYGGGWVVTDRFDGYLERYYLDYVCNGHIGAKTGFYVVDGASYFGDTQWGNTLRNVDLGLSAYIDNDGLIAVSGGTGWVVSDAFGELQRYWFSNGEIALGRLIAPEECGQWAYATQDGPVVRGKIVEDGLVYLADNDGVLESPGWVITAAYDAGTQQYRIDEATHACITGVFEADGSYFLGVPGEGYVLRGSMTIAGKTYYSDENGKLVPRISSTIVTAGDSFAIANGSFIGPVQYLFLPAYADITEVVLFCEQYSDDMPCLISFDGETYETLISGIAYDISKAEQSDSFYRAFCKIAEDAIPTELRIMISAEIASLFIVSDDPESLGRQYIDGSPDHSTRATGSLLMVDPDGSIVYDQALKQIKGRGNSTWVYSDKKPYQIKLDKKADLLETGDSSNKSKTWVLLSNPFDQAMLRNTILDDLALELGLMSSPQHRPVDLYYDGEYRGTYLLSEKIEIDDGRVDIADLEEANAAANPDVDLEGLPIAVSSNAFGLDFQYVVGMESPGDYSGGYLLECDNAHYREERCWFETSVGYFVVKAPENLSYDEMLYISTKTQAMINACLMDASDLASYIDIDSFSKIYLVNVFLKNLDWGFSSSYYYLPAETDAQLNHVFYAGPVWDGDLAMGLGGIDPWTQITYSGLFGPRSQTGPFMLGSTTEETVKASFLETLYPAVRYLLYGDNGYDAKHVRTLEEYILEINASAKMNYTLWDVGRSEINILPLDTFDDHCDYLRTWLAYRLEWFADEMATWPKDDVRTYVTEQGGIDYALVYDYLYYLENNPDVKAVFGDDELAVLNHFVVYGMQEGRRASRQFDPAVYRYRYSDLQDAFGSDWASYFNHFISYGFLEGRLAV